ncbi:MAG: ComEC/Rec2 family competence protein [Candidatus Pedobacter colombiensis]|uniref:ComEC/Rec2 family competence protein n=1 Tax=Candidatus Pedobacter colombiensis TaxID=3121371 RepID=A0AAJ5WE22_9SPHI|nr:ComEC/Rec2 family competence protein [Pedobacter sp.]WEK21794.1 MAG: ComEC/Rec2 family competence protein [Pedobacter sp.]
MGILSFYSRETHFLFYHLLFLNLCLFTTLFIINISYNKINIHRHKGINGVILHGFLFISGSLSSISYNDHINTDYYAFKKSKYLKIRIIDEPQNRQNIILFNAFTTKSTRLTNSLTDKNNNTHLFHKASGKIRVTIMNNSSNPLALKYGDELIIPARFSEIPPPLNPAEFDFKSWLATQNIYHQTILKQQELVRLNINTGNKLIAFALELRAKQVALYRKLIKNDDAFAVASTLILGYRADLSPEMLDTYSKTGTIHALSVSGMHVGLIYLVLNQLLYFLNRKQITRIIKTTVILGLIWFYTLLTGLSPSVLRSAVMISVFIVAKLFAKTTNSYNIIAFAAFCLLIYNPFLIWDVGFQLSFLSVLGLIYLQPKIEGWFHPKNTWINKIWGTIAMSLAAQLATYPHSVYYFHQFPIYFSLSNLFITIPTALIMYIGIIILLFKLDCLGPLFEWLINFTNLGLDRIAQLPFSGVSAIWISKTELMVLCTALILFIMALSEGKKRLLITATILFACLQSIMTYDKVYAFHQKKTIRFNLRKNYAVALICSRKAILFTDLQSGSKVFKYFVKPALDQHKVTQIQFKEVTAFMELKNN